MNRILSKNTNRPRIWHIGGEDVHMRIPLLRALRDRGFQVSAVGTKDHIGFIDANIPFIHFEFKRWISPLSDIKAVSELKRLVSQHRPDLIHGFDTKPALMAPFAANDELGVSTVRTINGMGQLYSSSSVKMLLLRPFYEMLQRSASRRSDNTVFQNRDDMDYFLSKGLVTPSKRVLIRSSGIDIAGLLDQVPVPAELALLKDELKLEGKIVISMVARLVRQKGVREYLECAESITSVHADVVFLLIGPTATEGSDAISESEIAKYSQSVTYLGPRNDIPALLALSTLFVLPTYYREGVPRVLLEAGAMGLPLVATDMPGCRDVVIDGWNGSLVRPRDSQSLASAIEKLIDVPSKLNSMGLNSRQHVVDNFELGSVADAHAALYTKLIDCRRKELN